MSIREKTALFCSAVVLLSVFALSGCTWLHLGETCLVKDGKPCADIVIAEKPPRMVKLAAAELQTYIEKISGAKLAITNAPGPDVPTHIYVGRSAETDKLKITDEGLKQGAFKMVSGKNWLALLGHDSDYTPTMPRWKGGPYPGTLLKDWDADLEERARQHGFKLDGEKWYPPWEGIYRSYNAKMGIWDKDECGSLNAVYRFLRDQGIRWYLPGELGEIAPKKASIELPVVDKTVRPDFALRSMYQYAQQFCNGSEEQILWQLRMGFNKAPDVMGSAYGVGTAHGMGCVFGREETQKAHPDYYKMENRKRATEKRQNPCLSSAGLFASNVKYARAMFELYDEPMVSVMPGDSNVTVCECELCKDKGTPERGYFGGISDYVWDYVNRVGQELYKTNPDKMISCCAYGGYNLPPTHIDKLSPNIVVGLAQTRRQYLCAFGKLNPKKKAQLQELPQEWLKKMPKGHTPFFIYDYFLYSMSGAATEFMPLFFPHSIAEDLHALKGISLGDYIEVEDRTKGLGVTHLNLYVEAQFLWNADQDVDRLLDEYYTLFYGPARDEMKAFIEYSEANWMYLDKDADKIGQVFALLGKAQEKVEADSVYARRIALIADYIRPLKGLQQQIVIGRGPVPEARILGERDAKDIKLDGRLDDVFWKGVRTYGFGEVETGREPSFRTSCMMAYAGDSLYFGIECKDASMKSMTDTPTQHDSMPIFNGESVEIMLETQTHSYYHFGISPAGGMIDIDQKEGNTLWSSKAEVATHIGDGCWSVEVRIPIVPPAQEAIDPQNGVAGSKPSETYPWYFNVYRHAVNEKGEEFSAFSPTGKLNFLMPLKFGKLYVR